MNAAASGAQHLAPAVLSERDRLKKARLVQRMAQEFRVIVLDTLHAKGTGHWGGASSAAELLVALYFDAMRVRPDEPHWPDRDRLVLSKGHASCARSDVQSTAQSAANRFGLITFISRTRSASKSRVLQQPASNT